MIQQKTLHDRLFPSSHNDNLTISINFTFNCFVSEYKTALNQSSRFVFSVKVPLPDRLGPFPNHGCDAFLYVLVPRTDDTTLRKFLRGIVQMMIQASNLAHLFSK